MIKDIFKNIYSNKKDTLQVLLSKKKDSFLIWAYFYLFDDFPSENLNKKYIKEQIKYRLITFDDDKFIEIAYLLILKRTPDEEGKKHYIKKLTFSLKEEVLDELSKSKEALNNDGIKLSLTFYQKVFYKVLPKSYKVTIQNTIKNQQKISNIHSTEIEKLKQSLFKPDLKKLHIENVKYIENAKKESKKLFNKEVDDFYTLFENIFYNSEIVKNIQRQYISYIKVGKVVDIGCGRGELLDILKENSISATGVEINPIQVALLKEKGFDVVNTDANTFLKENNNFDTITAIEVIEHMDKEYLKEFLKLSFESLKDDGRIILETVNPLSNTGLGNFYMDITHIKPLPPQLVAFYLEYIGFDDIQILYFSPVPKEYQTSFVEKNYQTYAVVGKKICKQ